MGNLCNRRNEGDDTRRTGDGTARSGGLTWASWRLAVNQDQAQITFKKMGCLYCLVFFIFGKFLCLALLFALPTVMIGMGSFYLDDCPYAPIIPIFLIVLGCFGIVETIIYGLRTCVFCERCEIPLFIWELSKCLAFGFFTWGSIGIFEIYEPNYDPKEGKYCDKILYLFAFGISIILWIFLVLFLLMCVMLIVMLATTKEEVDEEPQVDSRRQEPQQQVDSKRQEPQQQVDSKRQEPQQQADSKRQEPRQQVYFKRSSEVKK